MVISLIVGDGDCMNALFNTEAKRYLPGFRIFF